jgi:hypothetical protein
MRCAAPLAQGGLNRELRELRFESGTFGTKLAAAFGARIQRSPSEGNGSLVEPHP